MVLCDRFTDSTLVYQGCGRGLDAEIVLELDRIACQGLKPDVTVLIDIDLDTSLARAKKRNQRVGQSESRIDEESAAFHERVRRGYLALAAREPERFIVIDGRADIGEVYARIQEALAVSENSVFENYLGQPACAESARGDDRARAHSADDAVCGAGGSGQSDAGPAVRRPAAGSPEKIERDDLSLQENSSADRGARETSRPISAMTIRCSSPAIRIS